MTITPEAVAIEQQIARNAVYDADQKPIGSFVQPLLDKIAQYEMDTGLDATCRKLMKERDEASNRADIGPDPLAAYGEERKRLHDETRKRLEKARDLQQSGVPDQTALTWRIDISRTLDDLTIAEARVKSLREERDSLITQKDQLEKTVIRLGEALKLVPCLDASLNPPYNCLERYANHADYCNNCRRVNDALSIRHRTYY